MKRGDAVFFCAGYKAYQGKVGNVFLGCDDDILTITINLNHLTLVFTPKRKDLNKTCIEKICMGYHMFVSEESLSEYIDREPDSENFKK